jgi:hypothetical protein
MTRLDLTENLVAGRAESCDGGACLTGHARHGGPAIPTSGQNLSLKLQPESGRIVQLNLRKKVKIPPRLPWAAWVVSREGRPARSECPQDNGLALRAWPPKSGGARSMDTIKCNFIIETTLNSANDSIAKKLQADVIMIKAPMRPPVDDEIRDEIDELKRLKESKDKLVVILKTSGGFIETVERIVGVFRKGYKTVEFYVPNYAYSAGTVLVLSGDEIHMDDYSVLGPIDPQFESEGQYLPGMGYLAKFQELCEKINDPKNDPAKTRAELAFLINKFDPAKLFWIEQSTEHSKELLRQWLPKHKFKAWTKKEKSGAKVTDKDRQERADQIAEVLGNANRWHSHGRGITIRELESEEIKLKINNYSADPKLHRNLSHYYGLFIDYLFKRGFGGALHSSRTLRRLA